jgi:ornithine carbamoyltransferase
MRDHFRGRDFLTLMDYTREELEYFLTTSAELKQRWAMRESMPLLSGKVYAMIFEKKSTRTRNSFQAAVAHLGGTSIYMRPEEMQLSRGEPIKDTARILDRYYDGLFIRTFEQEIVEEFASYMKNPVINALTNLTHPCQALADLLTIREKKGDFAGLRICYAGDVYNVCHSLMISSAMFGMELRVAAPEGYAPNENVIKKTEELSKGSGGRVYFTQDFDEALEGADVIYGNTWHSMGENEKQKAQRIKDFMPYQINMKAVKKAKPDVIFMHCLPGYREEDMTDEVIESEYSVVWDQGENRMHTEKAVLVLVTI